MVNERWSACCAGYIWIWVWNSLDENPEMKTAFGFYQIPNKTPQNDTKTQVNQVFQLVMFPSGIFAGLISQSIQIRLCQWRICSRSSCYEARRECGFKLIRETLMFFTTRMITAVTSQKHWQAELLKEMQTIISREPENMSLLFG